MSTLHLIADTVTMAADDGLFGWATGEMTDANNALGAFVGLAAAFYFVRRSMQTGFSMAGVVMAGLVAVTFFVIFKNMGFFADKAEVEVNSAPAYSAVTGPSVHLVDAADVPAGL